MVQDCVQIPHRVQYYTTNHDASLYKPMMQLQTSGIGFNKNSMDAKNTNL